MSLEAYAALVVATIVVIIIPGPTVTVILANSLRYGSRAGLLNVLGTQIGLALMLAVLVVGLASVIEVVGHWFEWIRLVGAAYLVWIGFKTIRAAGRETSGELPPTPRGGFVFQGLVVILSNPKALLFFGAFFPQFIDPSGDYVWQLLLAGATFMVLATVSDGMYALLAGRLREMLSRQRIALVNRLSGLCMVCGGVWLALARRS
ncbi:LysE family translocator [Rhodoligotrophos defluvii]|uniref:LysE family translocator n=1 Tax=Rhodoligotrophos defluvii TaxID=2561934 RepID=UPI0010C9EE7D|nr:LysE family translocator [Rhodoligotrophos defluvii]